MFWHPKLKWCNHRVFSIWPTLVIRVDIIQYECCNLPSLLKLNKKVFLYGRWKKIVIILCFHYRSKTILHNCCVSKEYDFKITCCVLKEYDIKITCCVSKEYDIKITWVFFANGYHIQIIRLRTTSSTKLHKENY